MAAGACFAADPTTAPAAIPSGGVMPAPNAAIATINGKDINNKAFYDILMQVAGMRVFQQVFDLSLVQSACMNVGIPVSNSPPTAANEKGGSELTDRLNDELNQTIDALNIQVVADPKVTTKPSEDDIKKAKLQALDMALQRQGVTAVEFRIGLETRADLRAMARAIAKIDATPKEVDDAYFSEYGPRRDVHVFVLTDKVTAAMVKKAISEDPKKSPEEIGNALQIQVQSWKISENATQIEEIRKVVFSLGSEGSISEETKVAAKDGNPEQRILIKLDKIEPDRTKESPKSTMAEEIRKKVIAFKEGKWMNDHLAMLRANASVQINDPFLTDQFKAISDSIQRQAAAVKAQTEPASLGATSGPASPTPAPMPTIPSSIPSTPAGGPARGAGPGR
jgi:hypothetical protein